MIRNMKKKIRTEWPPFGILAVLLAFIAAIYLIFNCFPCLLSFLKPFEDDNRPEALSFWLTVIISVISGWFAYKQYVILKNRDKFKMQSFFNRIEVLLQNRLTRILDSSTSRKLDQSITDKEIQMIYELEELIYAHLHVYKKEDQKKFIQDTTEVISFMCELAYSINSIYECSRAGKPYSITDDDKKSAISLMSAIRQYRKKLHQNTDLDDLTEKTCKEIDETILEFINTYAAEGDKKEIMSKYIEGYADKECE